MHSISLDDQENRFEIYGSFINVFSGSKAKRNIGLHGFEPFNISFRPSNAKAFNKSKQGEWDTAHLVK